MMAKIKFSKARWSQDPEGCWLSLLAPNAPQVKEFVGTMKDKDYVAELKEHREKRSLDANAFCWCLIGKLAAATRQDVSAIYRHAIREIGDNFTVVPIHDDAVERWREIWEHKGTGWQSDILGPSKIEGYTNTINYYGSSVYDKRQMSCLIDTIVAECKDQGIPTETPEELSRMKEAWPR